MANGSQLPPPCELCAPYEGIGRLTEQGIAPCSCPRGMALREAKKRRAEEEERRAAGIRHAPILSKDNATNAVLTLDSIPFFPKEERARALIGHEIRAMVGESGDSRQEAVQKLRWLVTRMVDLYSKWPSLREMRLVYCQRYIALDGKQADYLSDVFLEDGEDGKVPGRIPAERSMPEPAPLALPPGHRASVDPQLDGEIRQAAAMKSMGPAVQSRGDRDRIEKENAFARAVERRSAG